MSLRLKVIIYGINYSPELTGVGKYTGELSEWLSDKGHNVKVITGQPYYPDWKIFEGFNSVFYSIEKKKNLKIIRCPHYVPAKPSGLKRIIHLLSFSFSSLPIIFNQIFFKPDVILFIEPPLSISPAAILVSKLTGALSWLHVQDFEVDAAFELGMLKNKFLYQTIIKLERLLISRIDIISSISEKMIEKLSKKSVLPSKQRMFQNWVDTDNIYPLNDCVSFRKQLSISKSKIVALYSGNMGEKQGLEIIVEAARKLQDNEDIIFLMCGNGSAINRLKEMSEGMNNVLWLPLQPMSRLNELLNTADIHLLPQKTDATDLVMPSKLTGMMASGKPVVATVDDQSQIAKVLEGAGYIVSPGNVRAFAESIIQLAGDKNQREIFGAQARQYSVDNLSKKAILNKFERELISLV